MFSAMDAVAGEGPQAKSSRPTIRGILYNEDDSHRFVLDPPGAIQPERLDQLVDELADTQVTVMLICCCAKTVNYPSQVWDVHCRRFDPSKDNRQPYFGDTPEADREGLRRWAHNLKVLLDAGIDPMQRMIDRCRQKGISPWVSIAHRFMAASFGQAGPWPLEQDCPCPQTYCGGRCPPYLAK
jgi:hypothetical protein